VIKRQSAFDPILFLARIAAGRSVHEYAENEIVFSQGSPAHSVYYVLKGKVKLTVVSSMGKEATIAILGPDDFFGEGCLTTEHVRTATATTVVKSQVTCIEKVAIQKLVLEEPGFSEMFIAHLLNRTLRVQADLVDQLFNSSEKRLARLLLLLANFGKEETPTPLISKISQETLAEMVGTTRSRVNLFMNKFRKLGLINYGSTGEIVVHKSLLNLVLHEQPRIET